ncbi:MAG: Sjogren's syndrome/scleroderma autoantigen 1 family protein [Candidatus Nitrosotalea sp.]|nr:Sjogren's syndrome/scleroderma autoantigen 1 family protein [Candidatus Nitrosotalea sp.]
MSKDLTKKAVELLLSGATLIGDPCPYCKGVRVMKNGSALCINCGRQVIEESDDIITKTEKTDNSSIENLDQKLLDLTVELAKEKDLGKQKQILETMTTIISIKEKLGAH